MTWFICDDIVSGQISDFAPARRKAASRRSCALGAVGRHIVETRRVQLLFRRILLRLHLLRVSERFTYRSGSAGDLFNLKVEDRGFSGSNDVARSMVQARSDQVHRFASLLRKPALRILNRAQV